jgi:hypothetical protein
MVAIHAKAHVYPFDPPGTTIADYAFSRLMQMAGFAHGYPAPIRSSHCSATRFDYIQSLGVRVRGRHPGRLAQAIRPST